MKNIFKIFAVSALIAVLSVAALALPATVTVGDTVLFEQAANEDTEMLASSTLQDGTVENPYLIATFDDFNKYANLINGGSTSYSAAYYKLFCNINCYGRAIVPFGTETAPFKGTFDGNGYALLDAKVPDKSDSGVIGYMTMGTIKNLRVKYQDSDTRKNYTNKFPKYFFGGIVGRIVVEPGKRINISGCRTSGNPILHYENVVYFGGIAGRIDSLSGNVVITDCLSDMSSDITSVKNSYLGGFAAYVQSGSTGKDCVIKNCVSLGDVSLVTTGSEATAASFVGYVQKDEDSFSGWASEDDAFLAAETVKQIENCVALGNVNAKSNKKVYYGIFFAHNANQPITMSNCYYSKELTVKGDAVNVTLAKNNCTKLESDMFLNQDFYKNTLGFDFDNKWYFTNAGSLGLRTTAKSRGAAVIDNNRDVRLTSKPGIRFRSEIEMEKRDYAVEYGIIVASKAKLGDEELTLDFDGKVVGVAYADDVDKFISKDDESIVFSAVVINIKEENYGSDIVARTYMKYVCEDETVVAYGAPVTTSLSDSAFFVRYSTNYEYLTDEQKALLETMLPKA